ncbi:uncharacterized protein [Epargyreus clarus]|uniref:uncharacterized protein n=1 Tax=Epargyreus clarus TaxID=520877 RepID=UPI003C2AFB73
MDCHAATALEDVLTLKQVHHILNQAVADGWQLMGSHIQPAAVGLSGFLGDHFRVTFHVKVKECIRKVNIFVKSLPLTNQPKADFINENNYYRREKVMFGLFEKILGQDVSDPWCARAYLYSDNIVVMPDLLYEGYRQRPQLDYLDLKHTLLATASLARFHAAFANYETKRSLRGEQPFNEEYAEILKEPTFKDSLWLHAAAKLTSNFLKAFSNKWNQFPSNLEQALFKLYIEACASLTKSDSLNVVNHKDLWVNNLMFKYEEDTPTNALLIDFQCIRYGPPAFDLMIFLYLNTSRSFREKYEKMIFRHYYVIFSENVDDNTKQRLKALDYDYSSFLSWCDKARMFGLVDTITIFPYVLMEPAAAQKCFDDPETYMKHCNEDRTEPVVAHARESATYKNRQLEVCEEFVERYVLKQL